MSASTIDAAAIVAAYGAECAEQAQVTVGDMVALNAALHNVPQDHVTVTVTGHGGAVETLIRVRWAK